METIYYCDYNRRKKCGNGPWCIGNDGPCRSTTNEFWARKNIHGEPIVNTNPKDYYYDGVKVECDSEDI